MRRALLLPLVLLTACFSENPSGGGPDGTTGEPCTPKSLGCACEDGACDTGLSCEPSIELCIDPSCMPGSELCTCVDGETCLQSLSCIGGLCRTPPGGESTGAPGTSSGMTVPPGDEGMTLPGDADVTGVSDTIDTITTSIGATDDGPPLDCMSMGCPQCYVCQSERGGACEMAWGVCKAEGECSELGECAYGCPSNDQECVQSCCATHGQPSGNAEFNAYGACLELACPACVQELSCVP